MCRRDDYPPYEMEVEDHPPYEPLLTMLVGPDQQAEARALAREHARRVADDLAGERPPASISIRVSVNGGPETAPVFATVRDGDVVHVALPIVADFAAVGPPEVR